MLVSPAERPVEFWSRLGPTSSIPEEFGADFLTVSPCYGRVGVQRKEIADLIASLADDRVTREVIDMKALDHAFWVLEGEPVWTTEGELVSSHSRFSLDSFRGVMLSLTMEGFHVVRTRDLAETRDWLQALDRWLAKPSHKGLHGRPKARGAFGAPSLTEQQAYVLQGLPGLGFDRAVAIVKYYGGLPIQLKPGVDLTEVDGIGKGTAERVRRVFGES